MRKVKLEVMEGKLTLRIGSYYTTLNESEYQDLGSIFSFGINAANIEKIRELEAAHDFETANLTSLISAFEDKVKALEVEIEDLRRRIDRHLPEDCIQGWIEVKFCTIRNGDGGECQHCR